MISAAVDLFVFLLWLAAEHTIARWLPWWRRYASAPPWALMAFIPHDCLRSRTVFLLVAVGLRIWNIHTANKNKRDGNDQHKAEQQRSERLTEVQELATRREFAEVRA